MIAVRTQRYKQQLFDRRAPLTLREAFSGSDVARTGFHNDCFLANATDYGTYGDREADLQWLHRESRFVPMGGETCAADEAAQPSIACDNALRELDVAHWNVLNRSWNPAVYDTWEQQGCLEEVSRRLGYRFVLESARVPRSVPAGGQLRLHLRVANTGFATLFNERPVEVVLRDTATGAEHHLRTDADPRHWPDGETTDVVTRVALPAAVTPGDYEVLVNLPDAAPTLRDDPRYSIRFANVGTWEPATGYNALGLRVTVTAA